MKKIIPWVAVLVIAGVLGYLNWDRISPLLGPLVGAEATSTGASDGANIVLPEAPEPRYRYVSLDPTTSTDVSFRESMKSKIVAAVQTFVPPKPATTKDGVAAITGLELTVRLVGTIPLSYGQPNYEVSIPSVPELPARPDMTANGALDPDGPYDQWKKAESDWSEQYDAALTAAEMAVATLQDIDLNRDEWSAVTASVAALTLLAPVDGDVAYLAASDLDENRAQQPASFNGKAVYIIQPDPLGDIGRWDALFQNFAAWATANGAGSIERVRPESADPVITTFIKGA
jgi:hypothetical protein